ncbi:WD40 repeat domain-containing protein [Rhodococcus sp. BH5]|uniref:WD40 repeat domain-containing protein n=1 Tax=Rhodococcus sp. BH5 TaxID=2871702 RepID=UPI0022CD6DBF|nr:hypothetical protein [Rhodococcus sp. BH5]MCZ9635136.1 hypothetical protein [Rhodococcus sp. BH5]
MTLRALVAAARAHTPTPPVDGLYSLGHWHALWEQAQRSNPVAADGRVANNETSKAAIEMTDIECPYRGLAAFGASDSVYFFGRDSASSVLQTKVLDDNHELAMTIVVGASGSGKSSLLHAGLLPALSPSRSGIELSPGRAPLSALQDALETCPDGHAIVVVDQFEELFTQCPDDTSRTLFVARLVDLARARKYKSTTIDAVVIAVRADFYEQCLQFPDLARCLEHQQMVLGPMSRDEIAMAVSGPANLVGVTVEPGLVDIMIRDLGAGVKQFAREVHYNASALPLLAHALLTTWHACSNLTLTIAAYESIGGVRGAVARTAEEVWSGLTATQQSTARQLLLRLVTVSEDGPDTRRRLAQSRLFDGCDDAPAAAIVLNALTEARLVTRDAPGIELTHEAVFEAWPRLAGWLREDRADSVLRQRIDSDAHDWDCNDHDSSLLYRGLRLDSAVDWAHSHSGQIGRSTWRFISAARRQDRRSRRRRRGVVTALAFLAVCSTVLAVTAQVQRISANHDRNDAQFAEVLAQAAGTQNSDPSLSAQLSRVATGLRPDDATAYAMVVAAQNAPLSSPMTGHDGAVYDTVVGPNGIAASASYDRTIRLWDTSTAGNNHQIGAPLYGHSKWVTSVAFSPDGRILASGSGDNTVRLWEVSDPFNPYEIGNPLIGHTGAIYMVAFSPDGRTLASASDDATVRLWNIEDPNAVVDRALPLRGHTAAVRTVAFSPDGRTLATGSDDRTALLWNVNDPANPAPWGVPLRGHTDTVHSVAFSPDGRILATGSDDQSVRLWYIHDPRAPVSSHQPITGHKAAIWSVAFSPDGTSLVSASWDGTAQIWALTDPERPTALGKRLAGSSGGLTSATFTHDGKDVVTGGQDGIIRVWTLPTSVLDGHTRRVTSPAIDRGGRIMATGSRDGTAIIWDIADGRVPTISARLQSPDSLGIENIALSPDGSTLATASLGSGRVQLWHLEVGGLAVPVGAPLEVAARYTHELAFSPDGRLLATAQDDQSIRLWAVADLAHPAPLGSALSGAGGWINAVAFSPDGGTVAAASSDETVRLWNVSDPSMAAPLQSTLTGHIGAVNSIAFSPDGLALASGSDDQSIRLWSLHTDQGQAIGPATILTGHTSTVRSVAFSPDGRTLASGSDDQTVRIWSVANPTNPHAVGASLVQNGTVRWSVSFSNNSEMLMATGEGGAVRALDLNPDRAKARVCSATRGNLTEEIWKQYLPHLSFEPPCG